MAWCLKSLVWVRSDFSTIVKEAEFFKVAQIPSQQFHISILQQKFGKVI